MSKGRSSSVTLNCYLRFLAVLQVIFDVVLTMVWLVTRFNPSDGPSSPPRSQLLDWAAREFANCLCTDWGPYFSPLKARNIGGRVISCREYFVGCQNLSFAIRTAGMHCRAFECNQFYGYAASQDLLCPEVHKSEKQLVFRGEIDYARFGLDCATWGSIWNNMNGGVPDQG